MTSFRVHTIWSLELNNLAMGQNSSISKQTKGRFTYVMGCPVWGCYIISLSLASSSGGRQRSPPPYRRKLSRADINGFGAHGYRDISFPDTRRKKKKQWLGFYLIASR